MQASSKQDVELQRTVTLKELDPSPYVLLQMYILLQIYILSISMCMQSL